MADARAIALAAMCGIFVSLPSVAGDTSRGEEVYKETCLACHGRDGSGSLPGVPDLGGETGPLSQADVFLLKRMADGYQTPGSPMPMPARGGDHALTDSDLKAVLRYMRKEFIQPR